MVSIDIYVNETHATRELILPTTSPLEHENYDLLLYNLAIRNVAKYSPVTIRARNGRETRLGSSCSRSPRRSWACRTPASRRSTTCCSARWSRKRSGGPARRRRT